MFLKLGTEGVDVTLGLRSCLLLILRQGGMEPLILLLKLVGTGRLVGEASLRDPRTPSEKVGPYSQMLLAGLA